MPMVHSQLYSHISTTTMNSMILFCAVPIFFCFRLTCFCQLDRAIQLRETKTTHSSMVSQKMLNFECGTYCCLWAHIHDMCRGVTLILRPVIRTIRLTIIKGLKKYSHFEENKIYLLIVCILENVFYDKFYLTSSFVSNFS